MNMKYSVGSSVFEDKVEETQTQIPHPSSPPPPPSLIQAQRSRYPRPSRFREEFHVDGEALYMASGSDVTLVGGVGGVEVGEEGEKEKDVEKGKGKSKGEKEKKKRYTRRAWVCRCWF